jgi:hypothetical protein
MFKDISTTLSELSEQEKVQHAVDLIKEANKEMGECNGNEKYERERSVLTLIYRRTHCTSPKRNNLPALATSIEFIAS